MSICLRIPLKQQPWLALACRLGVRCGTLCFHAPATAPMTHPHLPVAGNSPASRDQSYVFHPYTNLQLHEQQGPLVIERGRGVFVYDETGKEYLEGMSGLWCASLGWSEERLIEAAMRQLRRLPFYHLFNHKSHDPAIDLAERLIRMAPAPMSKVLFANSGSEANDTAIKLIWYYNNALGRPHKKLIISRRKAYHGVTVAAASLTGLPNNHRDFDLPIDRFIHTDCPHHYRFATSGESEEAFAARLADNLERLILDHGPDRVAAMFVEPVMGAGGVIVPPATYFEKVQAVLRKYDVLLVADEVICGFGRTGSPWGCDTFGIRPDILTCAKGLSAAYQPISATLVSEPIYQACVRESEKIGVFGHGFTYCAHPVSAAVALEALAIYEERDIFGHARRVAPYFQKTIRRLAGHPLVGEIRGVGLLAGIELVANRVNRTPFDPGLGFGTRVQRLAEQHGLIIRTMGDTIAVCPPLIVNIDEIDELLRRLTRTLNDATALARDLGWHNP
ncbi:Putrescine--pyruvate aminotransferase [Azospirillaceae bacterium]